MDSPFDVLGIDPDADDAAIRDAYRRRVKEAHPDRGGSAREFQRVKEAYEKIENGWEPDEQSEPSPRQPGQSDSSADDRTREPEGTRVEYLNYEVLGDHGWELTDEDLFEKAAGAPLDDDDYGELRVEDNQSLLEAAEDDGHAWPFACRGGACTNCAVAVVEGEMPTPTSHILPQEMLDRGIRLSCISSPVSDEAKIVFNVKYLPGVNELLLPASRFEGASTTD
ncbi:ferredoxin Fer [Halorientalis regularis]|uniref:Ferredoxin n=1 Tax=Halorientalis regularis TaxID=660518 RepID=A0A1G7FA76_9EURY|nr:ferredoxin Fer [Halorientalis regularis]SDE72848.1 Ferredoxin [Halorientalis regularis]